MDVHTAIPLKQYTSMRLGGPARFMGDVRTADDVVAAVRNARQQGLPVFILGGGNNTIVHDEGYAGLVLRNRIMGFSIVGEDTSSVTIQIGAGEDWDETVKRTVELNLTGIEALSAIPGTAGAAPIQNIGAYGQELADTFISLEAYDSQADRLVLLSAADCGFSYRHSIFRGRDMGRYVILSITLRLFKDPPQPPFYEAVQQYFDEHAITIFTPQAIREAVMAIRKWKLPDPKELPNAGSFFKNAIIEGWQLEDLRGEYPDMPSYDMGDGTFKIPTGWLIEQTGVKGTVIDGIRVHDKNALVLINESATSYEQLAHARDRIIGLVRDKFRIMIEQEPLEML